MGTVSPCTHCAVWDHMNHIYLWLCKGRIRVVGRLSTFFFSKSLILSNDRKVRKYAFFEVCKDHFTPEPCGETVGHLWGRISRPEGVGGSTERSQWERQRTHDVRVYTHFDRHRSRAETTPSSTVIKLYSQTQT